MLKIDLDYSTILKCLEFAKDSAKTQRPIEHGQRGARSRSVEEIQRDNIIGKLGEAAVQSFFASRGINFDLDMAVYARGRWDNYDIRYQGWLFDVKATKKRGHFFLIEWDKIDFQVESGALPQYYIMTRLIDEEILKIGSPIPRSVSIELAGFADVRSLYEGAPNVVTLEQGDCIPGTRMPMVAKSFAVEFSHLSHDWDRLVDEMRTGIPFSTVSYVPPGRKAADDGGAAAQEPVAKAVERKPIHVSKIIQAAGPKYSLLLSGDAAVGFSPAELENLIKAGIKLFVFVSRSKATQYRPLKDKYSRSHFSLYEADCALPSVRIEDGGTSVGEPAFLELENAVPAFNAAQFKVEHASTDHAVIVKASAGTGKTTVMIDRITYLLASDQSLRPADIGMITFTNKATMSMLEKLQDRMMDMYRLTGSLRWYEMLEELSEMRLSTIDSFFHEIIQTEGSTIGYGKAAKLQSFIYEKQKLVREIINDRFVKSPSGDSLTANVWPIHRYVSAAVQIWDAFHSRGYFRDDIENADFGACADDRSSVINKNLREIVIEAEKRYQLLKLELNAYALDDIKAETDALVSRAKTTLHGKSLRYLFVDEFQDTDNSQIRSIVWLKKVMNAQLFVVGDIKQSIYRFRGAEESAFDELKKCLKAENGLNDTDILEYVLSQNYRTAGNIIEKLNPLFSSWSQKGSLLTWEKNAVAGLSKSGRYQLVSCVGPYPNQIQRPFQEVLSQYYSDNQKICVLTRANYQVEYVAEWCREAGIPCIARFDGGFYQSDVVRDFLSLLGHLLYPDDVQLMFNLLSSPYAASRPDPEKLCRLKGKKDDIRAYLKGLLDQEGFDRFEARKRFMPFFPLIEQILTATKPDERLGKIPGLEKPRAAEADIERRRYQLNLNKLLRILYEQFTGDFASLLSVYDFLSMKAQTDVKEDTLYPTAEGCSAVESMTVHKAKGLEFDTVILPFTQMQFGHGANGKKLEVIIDCPQGIPSIGWSSGDVENLNFASKLHDEVEAVRRDEARLLYVALTRAKTNLIALVPETADINTWAEYLPKPRKEKKK